jgi:GAF domain
MQTITVHVPTIELLAPEDIVYNNEALKEYAWSHCKDEILQRMRVGIQVNGDSSAITTLINEQKSDDNHPYKTPSDLVQLKKSIVSEPNMSPTSSPSKALHLLNTIARVQRQFFHSESPRVIFGTMLDALLDLLDSEYGFIGEVKYKDDGTKYLQTHAITNIAWDQATRQFFDDNQQNGLLFTNLNSLFGSVITTESPVISNNPKTDKRSCGTPKGHPPLDYFLGIPFFMPGGEMNGMVGIANKPGGYAEEDIEFLEVCVEFWDPLD